jgi:hypothetical protein
LIGAAELDRGACATGAEMEGMRVEASTSGTGEQRTLPAAREHHR